MPTTISTAISKAAKTSRAEAIQIISEALSAYISREEQALLEHKIRVAFQMNEWRTQLITLSEKPLPPNSANLSQIIYKTGTLEKNLRKSVTQVLNPEKDPRDLIAGMTGGRILSNAAQSPHTSNVLGPFATSAPGPFEQTKTSESSSSASKSSEEIESKLFEYQRPRTPDIIAITPTERRKLAPKQTPVADSAEALKFQALVESLEDGNFAINHDKPESIEGFISQIIRTDKKLKNETLYQSMNKILDFIENLIGRKIRGEERRNQTMGFVTTLDYTLHSYQLSRLAFNEKPTEESINTFVANAMKELFLNICLRPYLNELIELSKTSSARIENLPPALEETLFELDLEPIETCSDNESAADLEDSLRLLTEITKAINRTESYETIYRSPENSLRSSPQQLSENENTTTMTDKQIKPLMKAALHAPVTSGQLKVSKQEPVAQNRQTLFGYQKTTAAVQARIAGAPPKGQPTGTRDSQKIFRPVTAKQSSPTATTKHRPGKTG